ncbi:50S ribosomal protein L35 [Coprothermobacteraceae bacterium]|nr:50S ribosomal protein L35 [Coprothermobacteraceae bacterium]
MGKAKTNRTAAKRFKVTGSGKYVYYSAMSHLRRKKSAPRLRRLRMPKVVDETYMEHVKDLLPNS